MSSTHTSRKTNFKSSPQKRQKGTGKGRRCFPWKRKYPWLVMIAEQIFVFGSGSEGALLENRSWSSEWGMNPESLRDWLEFFLPGINKYLVELRDWETPWYVLLSNRVYKMYYNGTSARGESHDARTRASISNEHWRSWKIAKDWEEIVMRIVQNHSSYPDWVKWVQ